jgi:hypothetical protein
MWATGKPATTIELRADAGHLSVFLGYTELDRLIAALQEARRLLTDNQSPPHE